MEQASLVTAANKVLLELNQNITAYVIAYGITYEWMLDSKFGKFQFETLTDVATGVTAQKITDEMNQFYRKIGDNAVAFDQLYNEMLGTVIDVKAGRASDEERKHYLDLCDAKIREHKQRIATLIQEIRLIPSDINNKEMQFWNMSDMRFPRLFVLENRNWFPDSFSERTNTMETKKFEWYREAHRELVKRLRQALASAEEHKQTLTSGYAAFGDLVSKLYNKLVEMLPNLNEETERYENIGQRIRDLEQECARLGNIEKDPKSTEKDWRSALQSASNIVKFKVEPLMNDHHALFGRLIAWAMSQGFIQGISSN